MGNDCRDLRARLEVAVAHVSELMAEASESPGTCDGEDYASDSEDAPTVLCNAKVTTAVRKKLAIAIRDLMEHGLTSVSIFFRVPDFLSRSPNK